MKAVVFYKHADAPVEKFMKVFPQHETFETEFIKSGKVLGSGAFSNPREGMMAIFLNKDATDEFVKGDPFVRAGLIAKVTVREWDDGLM